MNKYFCANKKKHTVDMYTTQDKRIIILYTMPISLWPILGKENRYFYTIMAVDTM